MPSNCTLEAMVRAALTRSGVKFVGEDDPRSKNLDFYLVDHDIHIEIKRFYSERISRQMLRSPNIIVLQGKDAVILFCRLLRSGNSQLVI